MSVQTSIKQYNVLSLETIPGNLEKIHQLYDPDSRVSKYIEAQVDFEVPNDVIYAGHGEIYRPGNCGLFSGFASCDICGKVRPLMDNCGKLTCPVCMRMAASRKGFHVAKSKVLPFINAVTTGSVKNNLPAHYVLSPTKEVPIDFLTNYGVEAYEKAVILNRFLWNKDNYKTEAKRKETLDLVRQIISKYLYASIIVFHPGRFYNEKIKKRLVWSPHYHIIGFRDSSRSDKWRTHLPPDTYRNIGCVFTHIAALHRVKDVTKCMAYLLTHTWIHTYRKTKKKRYWKFPDTKAKADYNHALDKDYEMYIDERLRSNQRAEYYLNSERFKCRIKSFDEWLLYTSTHSSPCYHYQGLIRPHNSTLISIKRKAEVIDCDSQECDGLMCEVADGVKILDVDSDRTYTPDQIKEFGIKVFLYDNFSYLIAQFSEKKLGSYMYRKYFKKKIHLDFTTKIWYQKRYRRKISRRLDIV